MSAHTPGPWVQDKYGCIKTPSGDILVVEGVALGGRSTEETRANARLIAASEDLLEAARKALIALRQVPSMTAEQLIADTELCNAIAKATGATS